VANKVFAHLLSLDLKFHLARQTGALNRVIDRWVLVFWCFFQRKMVRGDE
jgi:ABC-type transport system involved in Fe-S cluster assembly fused permease/ATPase subunit